MKKAHISVATLLAVIGINIAGGNYGNAQTVPTANLADTAAAPSATDTAAVPDTSKFVTHFVDLDHVVDFSAKDSLVLYGKKDARMYGQGSITYGQINLNADEINMDMDKSGTSRHNR